MTLSPYWYNFGNKPNTSHMSTNIILFYLFMKISEYLFIIIWGARIFLSWKYFVFFGSGGILSSLWGLSFPTRDWTRAPCIGSMESESLDSQGRPRPVSRRWPSFPLRPERSQLDSGCVLWQESSHSFWFAPYTPVPLGMLASILWSAWQHPDACTVRPLFPLDICWFVRHIPATCSPEE